jgi:hypothetical protein
MYPKIIEIELRSCGTSPGNGTKLRAHWCETFWSTLYSGSSIEVVTGVTNEGHTIVEPILRVANDCFKFRGVTYDFLAIRPAPFMDNVGPMFRALLEAYLETHDLENLYYGDKSWPLEQVEQVSKLI